MPSARAWKSCSSFTGHVTGNRRGRGVHFDDEGIFGKTFAKREDFALPIERDAVTVEDEFVIRADGVNLHEWDLFVAGDALQHGKAGLLLAHAPRGSGNVEDQVRALGDEFLHGIAAIEAVGPEIFVVPDVLADGDAELATVEHERRDTFSRLEVTVLVEDIVRRQQRFCSAPDDQSVLENGS
jgi:hypothetical protein